MCNNPGLLDARLLFWANHVLVKMVHNDGNDYYENTTNETPDQDSEEEPDHSGLKNLISPMSEKIGEAIL